ncbi:hypothetical protein PHYPSEUDO_015056 [Phytophthora pseudosyringae]|uniref:Uncharacterized protein n=1 Tax=Phytophthora pseudosyringae TaxID=221518 RepID=A0A8T1WJJ7_9STRA|nr:hypothetical protein PHYPSEUDO_015056 [Phytophthora pseudosyringae]
MKSSSKFTNALVSVEAAWVCAADVDVQREEEERVGALARLRKQSVKDKYELATRATRLDQELQEQQLQWKKKTEMRRLRQLPIDERGLADESSSNNNRKKGSIYAMENLRLAMLMKDTKLRQRVKRKKVRPRIVQDMLTLERRYSEAARKLQKWWRAHLNCRFWQMYLKQVKAVVQIQRLARGYLTRRWVRIWHANRSIRVTRLQALFRGYYIRCKVLPTWKRWEHLNAAKIQSITRVYFAQKLCRRYKREVAALHIQSVWRGFFSRKRSDIIWLEARATNLQRLVRGTLARKQTRRRAARLESGAIQIQRMFRGMRARMEINALLRDRETINRVEFMAVLETEEEWHRVQRDKLQARLNRKQLQQRVAQLEYEYYSKHEEIQDMESIYLDMQTQRMRVSPRAIEHGWVEEMEAKMKQQRALITKMKLETVFGLGLEFKRKEKELDEFQQRIDAIEERRRRVDATNIFALFEIWRNEEFLDNWERECRFRHQAKLKQRRQQVAETRRRWQVQFYWTNGKHDNRWRGTCWSPDVLEAAKEKEIFCIGSTDILALVHDKWRLHKQSTLDDEEKERDTREHIGDLTDQVALTTATVQIEQTKALFDPVFRDVERSFDIIQVQQRQHDKRLVATRQDRTAAGKATTDEEDQTTEDLKRAEDPIHKLDRQQRKRQLMLAAKVPWHLLDQLEAERCNLANEKAMFKLWGKTYSGE